MIVIVDYGVGNLRSVYNMIRKLGLKVKISGLSDDIKNSDKLILPGVGHFSHGMKSLQNSGLIPVLEEQVLGNSKPVLGICLGMQMMTNGSEESNLPGLGWVDAFTERFPTIPSLKIPHMGWNSVVPNSKSKLFSQDVHDLERFYFVHSYHVNVTDDRIISARCNHGIDFVASYQCNNIHGVQFHPEKSHIYGMALFKRFLSL